MESTYFVFEDQLYEQTEGAPMGSPLSPVIADPRGVSTGICENRAQSSTTRV